MMNINKIAKAIEQDAGEKVPGIRSALREMKDGIQGREYSPEQLVAIAARRKTGLSQDSFSALINTPVGTVRDWEQGRHSPSGAALCLLKIILKNPSVLDAA